MTLATLPTHSNVASVNEIRSHFPALERIHNGHSVAYFDGPGGTQVPRSVVEAMNDYLYHHNANTHWAYPTSSETDEIIEKSRETIADFLNASADEIAFGQNMTSLTFHLARSLGRDFEPGDEIIVTELDHHANVDTWRSLEKDRGIVIRVVPMNVESGQLELDVFTGLLSEKTKLVAIGAASNALGTINDVESIVRMAKDAGALTFVDAVHYAAHELIDVKAIGCDFLACSAYKFYGPHIGILFGRKELLSSIDFPKLRSAPDYAPERLETGTQNHEAIAGSAAAVDFLASLAPSGSRRERLSTVFEELHSRQHEFVRHLWDGLSAIKGVTVYGPLPDARRTSTISFTVRDARSETITRKLAEEGVFTSNGNFYALTVVERLGVEGLVRTGCSCYTTREEVDRLLAGVDSLAN
ncbi:MAG TPA: cysteine desulfurase-like protein [Pyrinomonadaceae bacterium]|jgi:cysteine desulfurase family protein (TIGR01976 family)|nr:cysteine desulfurase-like protein [Pyrinomonadaceae bacterium]